MLASPLVRDGGAYGAIFLYRREPQMFDPDQVELIETFAQQAAIAIESVRRFHETREALEQQTATAEVLKAISRSTFELEPVLQTLVENATRLSEASSGFIFRPEGAVYKLAVSHGASPEFAAHIAKIPVRPERGYLVGHVVQERRTVHVEDALADPDYSQAESQRLGGYRTMLGVPMMRADDLVGVLVVWRPEVRPFTERQIALVTTFADQAAIAIENVRLFNETREALEQQTATAEVLKTISRSTFELEPGAADARRKRGPAVRRTARIPVPVRRGVVSSGGRLQRAAGVQGVAAAQSDPARPEHGHRTGGTGTPACADTRCPGRPRIRRRPSRWSWAACGRCSACRCCARASRSA